MSSQCRFLLALLIVIDCLLIQVSAQLVPLAAQTLRPCQQTVRVLCHPCTPAVRDSLPPPARRFAAPLHAPVTRPQCHLPVTRAQCHLPVTGPQCHLPVGYAEQYYTAAVSEVVFTPQPRQCLQFSDASFSERTLQFPCRPPSVFAPFEPSRQCYTAQPLPCVFPRMECPTAVAAIQPAFVQPQYSQAAAADRHVTEPPHSSELNAPATSSEPVIIKQAAPTQTTPSCTVSESVQPHSQHVLPSSSKNPTVLAQKRSEKNCDRRTSSCTAHTVDNGKQRSRSGLRYRKTRRTRQQSVKSQRSRESRDDSSVSRHSHKDSHSQPAARSEHLMLCFAVANCRNCFYAVAKNQHFCRLVTPIYMKITMTERYVGPLGLAKFHLTRCSRVAMWPKKIVGDGSCLKMSVHFFRFLLNKTDIFFFFLFFFNNV